MELEMRHLRVVVQVTDSGSVSKAAAVLGVSQPSLTAQLQRIERAVGGRLFERSSAGVAPTALGRYVTGTARAVLAHVANLTTGLDRPAPPGRFPVRVGGVPGPLPAALAGRIRELDPTYEVSSFVELSARILLQLLHRDRLDVAVVREIPGFALSFPSGVEHRVLVPREPLFVGLADTHPLARRPVIGLAALADEEWIHQPPDDSGLYMHFRAACEAAGFLPKTRHLVADADTARELVVQRNGVVVAQATSHDNPGVALRPLAGDPLYRRISIVWRSGFALADRAEDLHHCAAEAYVELVGRNRTYPSWWAEHPEIHPTLRTA